MATKPAIMPPAINAKFRMSVGVACYRRLEDMATLIARADEAMYLAKRTGRNRVCDETMLDAPVAVAG